MSAIFLCYTIYSYVLFMKNQTEILNRKSKVVEALGTI